jgi:hypothetical protein
MDCDHLVKEKISASLFLLPSTRSVIISAATRINVIPFPPKPSA